MRRLLSPRILRGFSRSRSGRSAPTAPSLPLLRFRSAPVRRAFGLDISSTSLEGVELVRRRKEGLVLHAYNRVLLPPGAVTDGTVADRAAFIAALRSLLHGARPNRFSRRAVVTLPESKVYLHTFEFPSRMREAEVRAAIPYEVEGVLPVDLADMETDLVFHRSRDRKEQHVLFAAVPRAIVEQYQDVLRDTGIEPVAFETESAGLTRSLIGMQADPVLLADIGGHRTTLIVVERGAVHGAVNLPVGGDMITAAIARAAGVSRETAEVLKETAGMTAEAADAVRGAIAETLKPVLQEMRQLLRGHESHTGRSVKGIVLAGGSALLPGLDAYLQQAAERGVSVGDPFALSGLRFPPSLTAEDIEWLQRGRLFFAASVGVALRGAAFDPPRRGVNLLPLPLRRHYLWWRENLALSVLSLVVSGVLTVLLVVLSGEVVRTHFALRSVRAEVEAVRSSFAAERFASARADAEAALEEIEATKAFTAQVVDPEPLLERVRGAVPAGVRLTKVDVEIPAGAPASVTAKLQGVASTRETFLAFERTLRAFPGVTAVDSPLENLDRPTAVPFTLTLTFAANAPVFTPPP